MLLSNQSVSGQLPLSRPKIVHSHGLATEVAKVYQGSAGARIYARQSGSLLPLLRILCSTELQTVMYAEMVIADGIILEPLLQTANYLLVLHLQEPKLNSCFNYKPGKEYPRGFKKP